MAKKLGCDPLLQAAFQEGLRIIFYRGSAGCQTLRPREGIAVEHSAKPSEAIVNLRALAHDLSNSLETVLQAAYLLQGTTLDARNKKWVEAIDIAARDAARINREIRKILES